MDSDRLSSRYLRPTFPEDVDSDDGSRPDLDNLLRDDTDRDFEPGNRLEASGFNADDLPAFLVSCYFVPKLLYTFVKLFVS